MALENETCRLSRLRLRMAELWHESRDCDLGNRRCSSTSKGKIFWPFKQRVIPAVVIPHEREVSAEKRSSLELTQSRESEDLG
jgi:hypothetical protein